MTSLSTNQSINYFIKLAAFIIILAVLLTSYAPFLRKHTDTSYRWKMFYEKVKKENIDLLFLGTSHMIKSFDSRIFENRLNISVYNMGMSAQPISQTYYTMLEALKYTTPKIIVMDALMLNRTEPIPGRKYFIFEEIASMRFSLNKIRDVLDILGPKDWINAFFPAIHEHENWKDPEMIKNNCDFLVYNKHVGNKIIFDGFMTDITVLSEENLRKYREMPYTKIDFKIGKKAMYYIEQIDKICREKNIELIFVNTAVPKILLEKTNYMDIHHEIERVIELINRPFIDFNFLYDEIGFDNTCFMDEYNVKYHHLNSRGATLTSNYLAGYLADRQ